MEIFDLVGMESMRRSVLGGPLPGARSVSLHLFPDVDRPDTKRTFFLMSFGQFLDHDLTHTAITKASRDDVCECDTCSTRHFRLKATSSFLACLCLVFDSSNMEDVKCGFDGCETRGSGLESCWPIPVPDEDVDFRYYNRCLKFVRSAEVPPLSCDYSK